jgi:chemotaxis protein histidine kinase CheA
MAVFTPEELEPDILHDLKEEIFDLYESSLQNLVELELTPHDNEMQRALFRSVHTIKGDLGLVGFTPMIEVLQYLEDILDMLRKGETNYTSPLHDFVVRILDKVSTFVDDIVKEGKAEYDKVAIDATSEVIKQFTQDNKAQHEVMFKQAIATFSNTINESAHQEATNKISIPKTGIPKKISPDKQAELLFFRELIRPIEKRIGVFEGKADRIAALALYVNAYSENSIAEDQLAVACYVHDFGMAFMPEEIIKKQNSLSDMETNLLRSHVYKSTRLLEQLTNWDEARKIIMQHHERADGSGYPLGIARDDICAGAKLLAIVETYINLVTDIEGNSTSAALKSNAVAENGNKTKPLSEVDAVIALNKDYKGQFSGNWLRTFNKAMTAYLNQ